MYVLTHTRKIRFHFILFFLRSYTNIYDIPSDDQHVAFSNIQILQTDCEKTAIETKHRIILIARHDYYICIKQNQNPKYATSHTRIYIISIHIRFAMR